MNGGVCLAVEVDPARLERRVATGYCDERDRRPRRGARAAAAARAAAKRRARVGLLGNAADVLPELVRRGVIARRGDRPDLGARSAERLRPGWADARRRPRRCARAIPRSTCGARAPRWRAQVEALLRMQDAGAVVFDYGNNLRGEAASGGLAARAGVLVPGLRAGVHPPAVLPRQGPVPLGRALGRSRGHPRHRPRAARAVPGRRACSTAGSRWPTAKVPFQGLPARICWLGYGERAPRRACGSTELVRDGPRQGADRDRARPPRHRLGRLALPRDRGDAGRHATRSPTGRS